MAKSLPYAHTPLSAFITQRILQMRPLKSQVEIATEAGFVSTNMLSMVKSGKTRLPLDRVPALARALDCDPRRLFQLAIAQGGYETTRSAIEDVFGTIITRNEAVWLEEIRAASDHMDPTMTARARSAIRAVFGK